ncbi:PspC domain-containing protein [Nocardia farcinica]|nr:PspC domain-containing protein [Nocardia farcinica]
MENMTRTTFGDQLQQMWQTRPVRLPRQGPIAGVAAGFGQRYNVDPVLIRVAFVVSSMFGGAGIVLYLFAWLMLSEAGERSSPAESLFGKGHSSQSQTKTVVLIVALAIAVTTVGPIGVGLAGSGMISLALMLAGWWMLFMRCPQPPPGTSLWDAGYPGGTATGYPGTAFPTGPMRTTGGFPMAQATHTTPMYTPYTKLPDTYIPDDRADAPTVELHKRTASTGTTGAAATTADSPAQAADPTGATAAESGAAARSEQQTSSPPAQASESAAVPEPTATGRPATGSDTDEAAPVVATTPDTTALDTPGRGTGHESGSGAAAPRPTPSTRAAAPPPVLAGPVPPSWDPLGVAPLAWDLPEPTPARPVVAPPPKRPRSRLTPVVLGLAIMAAAGAGALAAAGVEWMTPGRIGAVALAVIGLGLVLGAFLRRGYGLLVVTAPLAGFVLLASLIGPIEFDRGAMGEHVWAPPTAAELRSDYRVTMGSGTLDLRSIELTENRTVNLDVQMGEARILVPAGMTVHTDCSVRMGENLCPEGITGPNTPGAPVLDLNVDVRMGSVEVQRG